MVIKMQIRLWLPAPAVRLGICLLLLYRTLRYGYPFRRIKLTRGKFAIVDPEDYHRIIKYKWHARREGNNFYAGSVKRGNSRRIYFLMHRMVINAPANSIVDHINHNGLDNRKANLRIVTQQQNIWNSRLGKNRGKSKYKGVFWDTGRGRWAAAIKVDRKFIRLGYFDDEISAARAYDRAAKKHRGQYAYLNFPD